MLITLADCGATPSRALLQQLSRSCSLALQTSFSTASILTGRSLMDTQQIISELEAQRGRLEQAISALRGAGNGRRSFALVRGDGRRRRRHLSAAAKKRISQMMRKSWAERKRAMKKAA